MNTIRYLLQVTVAAVLLVGLSEVSHAAGAQCGRNAEARIAGIHVSGGERWCRCTLDNGIWVELYFTSATSQELFRNFCNGRVNDNREKERLARENRDLAGQNDSLEADLDRCRANADACQQSFRDAALACLENTVSLVATRNQCGSDICHAISFLPPFPSDNAYALKAKEDIDNFMSRYNCPEEEPPVIEGANINPASAVIDPSRFR